MEADAEKGVHKAELTSRDLPESMHEYVKGIVRQAALDIGWRAKYIAVLKDRVTFVLKPYPLEKRLADEAKSEYYRQEARRRRSGTPLDRAKSRNPAP